MKKTFKKILIGAGAGVLSLSLALTVSAAGVLFGGATMGGGYVTLVSNTSDLDGSNDFSGIAFDDANGMTVSALTALGTGYNVTDDDCLGGSPRFQIRVDTDGNGTTDGRVFVYIGPVPSFSGCAAGWQATGNLLTAGDTRFDLTQFGGPFYGTYADMITLVGSGIVRGISLVVDAGWAFGDGEQTILVDNVDINGTVYTFTAKEDCKDGGWEGLGFTNQGQCVSSVVSNNP